MVEYETSLFQRLSREHGRGGRPSDRFESIRESLEQILNTRQRPIDLNAAFKELPRSLLTYGIPDFTGLNFGAKRDHETLQACIREAVGVHEPRLRNVRVVEQSIEGRVLAIVLEAEIDDRSTIRFDTTLDCSNAAVTVEARS